MTAAQEQRLFQRLNGKDPRRYGLDFGLWTLEIVGKQITQRFDVTLSPASAGVLLA